LIKGQFRRGGYFPSLSLGENTVKAFIVRSRVTNRVNMFQQALLCQAVTLCHRLSHGDIKETEGYQYQNLRKPIARLFLSENHL
jgi:hypothetical protein